MHDLIFLWRLKALQILWVLKVHIRMARLGRWNLEGKRGKRTFFLWKPPTLLWTLNVEVSLGNHASSRLFWEWADFQRGTQGHARRKMLPQIEFWSFLTHLLKTSLLIKTSFGGGSECDFQKYCFLRALEHCWGAPSFWKYNKMEKVVFIVRVVKLKYLKEMLFEGVAVS